MASTGTQSTKTRQAAVDKASRDTIPWATTRVASMTTTLNPVTELQFTERVSAEEASAQLAMFKKRPQPGMSSSKSKLLCGYKDPPHKSKVWVARTPGRSTYRWIEEDDGTREVVVTHYTPWL